MRDWNTFVKQAVEEFRPKKTVIIPIKQASNDAGRKVSKMLVGHLMFGVLVNMALFLCWLTNRDTQSYLILNSLFSILYGCYMLQKA